MNSFWSHLLFRTLIALLMTILSGCMVGPNFKSPAAPNVAGYTEKPLPMKTASAPGAGQAGKSQYFVVGEDIPGEWWRLFRSPALDELVRVGLVNSPNIAAAQAKVWEAQEILNAQIGELLIPNVTGSILAYRQKTSGASFGDPGAVPPRTYNLYNPSVNVTYTLDLFGGNRRQIEGFRSQVDYQEYQLMGAYLTLTSDIVTTAINVASLEAQIKATHQLIHMQEKTLTIVQKQLRLGGVSGADVLSQQSQLAQLNASLPPLEKNLAQTRHALAVLVGTFPSDRQIPTFDLESFTLPLTLPVSLPSFLIRQRPDIQAAEAQLHEASAKIGVATANLLPKITLGASYGQLANKLNNLFTNLANVWAIGGQLTQPIFDAGALLSRRRAAKAVFQHAFAQYRQTVLQAFKNVADTLAALDTGARALKAEKQAELAALGSYRIIQKQFRLGGASYLALLNAERQYQQSRIRRIQAQAARYADTAALFKALGGGWWNSVEIVTNGK